MFDAILDVILNDILDVTLNDTLDFLRRLFAMIMALFGMIYTILYCMFYICLLSAGACLCIFAWCILFAVLQSVAEHIPLKRCFDRRLQKSFVSKIKEMERTRNATKAKLVQMIEDIKIRNAANNKLLKDIRTNEAIIKRKIRGFESRVVNRYQVDPTVPGVIVPLHQQPEAPSNYPFIRWLYAQDFQLYYHECAVSRYEAQISGEHRKIQQLDEECAYLEAILDDTNTKRSRVQYQSDLPKQTRMAKATHKYLAEMRTAATSSQYPHFTLPHEYHWRPIAPPPPTRRPEPARFDIKIPKMKFGPMMEAASRPPLPTHTLCVAPPSDPNNLFGDPPRLMWRPSSAWEAPSVSAPAFASSVPAAAPAPVAAPAPAPAPAPALGPLFGAPQAAPAVVEVTAKNPLSLSARLSDPAGVRAPLPSAGPPPTNPLSLAARLTDPSGVRAAAAPAAASVLEATEPAQSDEEIEADRRRARVADRELARDRLAARCG